VVLWRNGAVQCARGTLACDSSAPAADNLRNLTASLGGAAAAFTSGDSSEVRIETVLLLLRAAADGSGRVAQMQYLQDARAVGMTGREWVGVGDVCSVLVQPLAGAGDCLFVFAPVPRAFDAKARALVGSLGAKLSGVLS
jgi:hypothetical protein